MKRFLPLIILTGLLFGQDKKDIIELTDGSFYLGKYVKIEAGNVYFRPEGAFGAQPIEINKVRKLELSDGLVLIRYGTKVDSDSPKSGSGFGLRNFGGLLIGVSGITLLLINNRKIGSDSTIEEMDDFIDKQEKDINFAYIALALGGFLIALSE